MKSVILEKKNNHLLGREEVVMEIEANSTPNFAEAAKIVASELKSAEDALKVKKIDGKFGTTKFKIYAHVYGSKDLKEKTEKKSKKEKAAAEVPKGE